jgi:hypothetical protein
MIDKSKKFDKEELILSKQAILNVMEKTTVKFMEQLCSATKLMKIENPIKASFDHWVASVILDTSKAKLMVRVHFKTKTSRKLLNAAVEGEVLEPEVTHDHMREYCNMVMGRLKALISDDLEDEVIRKVFLPEVQPSYDDYQNIPVGDELPSEERWWKLELGHPDDYLLIYGSVTGDQLFDRKILASLAKDDVVSLDDSGEISFF